MSCVQNPIQTILGTECIGDSLPKINTNFSVLGDNVCQLLTAVDSFNVVDSPTVDLTFDSYTRTLSADVKDASVTNAKIAFDGGSFCFRNKIINGDMRIDQRRAGAVYTQPANTAGYGSCDRWFLYPTGSALSAQRVSGTLFNTQYALALSGATGNTQTQLFHRIESANCYDLTGQTVTLSFNACSNTSLSAAYALTSLSGAADVWNNPTLATPINFAGGTFNLTTIPTKYSFTCVVPSSATNGIQIALFGNALNASQAIYLTNVQLEEGPTATPFEHRPIGTELALCQRYYQYNIQHIHNNACTYIALSLLVCAQMELLLDLFQVEHS